MASREYMIAWRAKNKEKTLAYKAEYRKRGARTPLTPDQIMAAENSRATRWHHANPERARHSKLLRKYGITLDSYNAMFAKQGGVCAICHSDSKKRKLDVDHCHTTGKIRGLLCRSCNMAIGRLGDSADILASAARYLITNGG